MPKGKPYPPEFKAKISLEATEGGATVNEIAAKHDLNSNLIKNRKVEAEAEPSRVFSVTENERTRERELAEHEEAMHIVDEIHLEMPYLGARKVSRELRHRTRGRIDISRKATTNLMEEMNVRSVCPIQAGKTLEEAPPPAEEQGHAVPEPGVAGRHILHAGRGVRTCTWPA